MLLEAGADGPDRSLEEALRDPVPRRSGNLVKASSFAAGSTEAAQPRRRGGLFFLAVCDPALEELEVGPTGSRKTDPDFAIEQLLNRAVASHGGRRHPRGLRVRRPDISVLSEEFLIEIQNLEFKNLAVRSPEEAPERRDQGANPAATWSERERFSDRCMAPSPLPQSHRRCPPGHPGADCAREGPEGGSRRTTLSDAGGGAAASTTPSPRTRAR